MHRNPRMKINRKQKRGPLAPCSSYPETEAGVAIFTRATRSASPRKQPIALGELRKPIVSIYGRDVEKIPGRAA
jgi:hypothetical protein